MTRLGLLLLISFILLSIQGPSNCNGSSRGNGLEIELSDDCVDADLCRFDCSEIKQRPQLILMKLDLQSPKISDEVKDAYYKTCAWNLERKEILTDMKMDAAQGRGQIISQFIAIFARKYRNKLPKPKKPVGDSPHTLFFSAGRAPQHIETRPQFKISSLKHADSVKDSSPRNQVGIPQVDSRSSLIHAIASKLPPDGVRSKGPETPIIPVRKGISNKDHARLVKAGGSGAQKPGVAGSLHHFEDSSSEGRSNNDHAKHVKAGGSGRGQKPGVAGSLHHFDASSGNSNANSDIWVPTVQTMRDWVDYLIYVSNQYTFFKDLCKKHGDVHIAQRKLIQKLQNDANIGLYPRYTPRNVPTIRNFVNKALSAIIKKFGELYNNPQHTCPCMGIMKQISSQKDYGQFMNILNQSCIRRRFPIRIPHLKKSFTRVLDEERIILDME